MTKKKFAANIKQSVAEEVALAAQSVDANDLKTAFHHLERAHVLGQAVTSEHTRVHWLMLKIGWKRGDLREIFGQLFRIVGASTKTPFGIYPRGNTGGANISPFKPLPVPADLQETISQARGEEK